jgi:hypothetical protein
VRSTAFAGGLWSDQVEPLFEVPTTYGVELRLVPTAMHVVSFGHSIADRRVPIGMEVVGVQSVRSTVLRLVEPPPLAIPAATHVVDPAQEILVKVLRDG